MFKLTGSGSVFVRNSESPLASWCGLTACVQENGNGETNRTFVLRAQSSGTVGRGEVSDSGGGKAAGRERLAGSWSSSSDFKLLSKAAGIVTGLFEMSCRPPLGLCCETDSHTHSHIHPVSTKP